MTKSLIETQAAKRAKAHAEFIDRAWGGADAADLLTLAESAGLTAAEADKLIGEIAEARPDLILSAKLRSLRQKANAAQKAFEETDAKNQPLIDQLENETEAAARAADAARRAAQTAEAATRRLLLLDGRGLLPGRLIPRGVLDMRDQSGRNEKLQEADRRRIEAFEAVTKCKRAVRELENVPGTIDTPEGMRRGEHIAQERVEAAQADLDAAEAALKAAEAEVEKLKSKK